MILLTRMILHLLSLNVKSQAFGQVLFVSRSSNDAPAFYIIGNHGDTASKLTDAIFDVNNEQGKAEEGALGKTTLNHNLGRMLVADMDSFRAVY
ncbi:unnamed protein product [Dibothriocephalus latus]|uniref:Uncharacterized protein n=1 Tax=Dibothriocephalus latus TaxID=60516 RepID=A0A3P7MMK2_DIBLA|nr:unnamed protein product [Dibothriocephalus latus]